jgi:hypothetical protein
VDNEEAKSAFSAATGPSASSKDFFVNSRRVESGIFTSMEEKYGQS